MSSKTKVTQMWYLSIVNDHMNNVSALCFLLISCWIIQNFFPPADMISQKRWFDFQARKTFVEKLLGAVEGLEILLGNRNRWSEISACFIWTISMLYLKYIYSLCLCKIYKLINFSLSCNETDYLSYKDKFVVVIPLFLYLVLERWRDELILERIMTKFHLQPSDWNI